MANSSSRSGNTRTSGKITPGPGGYDPANTPRTSFRKISESEATELLAFIVESLCMQFALTPAEPPKRNGAAPQVGTADTWVDVRKPGCHDVPRRGTHPSTTRSSALFPRCCGTAHIPARCWILV